jgi:formate dehydrogenase subunit gamma
MLVQGLTQYPGSRYTTAGEAWRQVRNQWILPYGGALLLIAALAMAMFHWRTGGIGGHERNTGRLIERFTYFERAAHWAVAISFVILAVSGIVIAVGKYLLLPILGATLFGWLGYAMKNLHNFAGPVFAVALLVFVVGYLRDNLPRAGDLGWLAKGGGMLSGEHVPSGKFNAGEKIVFWGGGVALGIVVVASGLVLDQLVPGIDSTRSTMQIAHIVHGVSSFLMMAMFIGHMYMGSIGVKGSFQAMRTGYVDEAWAKDHHELWYDDIKAGRVPAIRSDAPVPMSGAAAAQARTQ